MFEFLKGVRNSEVHGHTKFLILSLAPGAAGARLHGSTARSGMALGADEYAIMSVFDPHELVALIKKLLPSVPMVQQSATEGEKHRAE